MSVPAITLLVEHGRQTGIHAGDPPRFADGPSGLGKSGPKTVHAAIKIGYGEGVLFQQRLDAWLLPVRTASWPLEDNPRANLVTMGNSPLKVVPQFPM